MIITFDSSFSQLSFALNFRFHVVYMYFLKFSVASFNVGSKEFGMESEKSEQNYNQLINIPTNASAIFCQHNLLVVITESVINFFCRKIH